MATSALILLAGMLLWKLLRCASKDEVLYFALGVEAILRRLRIVAAVERLMERGRT
jgi:hypothetical protein